MRCLLSLAVILVGAAAASGSNARAQEERLAAIRKEYADATAAYYKALQMLPDGVDRYRRGRELATAYAKTAEACLTAAVETARVDPTTVAGFAALEWVLFDHYSYRLPAGKTAMELVVQYHVANPKVGKLVARIGYYLPAEKMASYQVARDLIKAVADRSPDRTARGQAMMALALEARDRFRDAEKTQTPNVNALAGATKRALEIVRSGYGDCRWLIGNRPLLLGDEAESYLYELRYLRMGSIAPEIEGEDMHGSRFRLSDYRGKVVLLVFWASWCGPCMGDVPHERELVEKLKGRPFALVGVNGDMTREGAQRAIAKNRIAWRSFWNGADGPRGSIASTWNIRGWPTVYVIDHQGVIRQKYLRGKSLDGPLQSLVAEAEQTTRTSLLPRP